MTDQHLAVPAALAAAHARFRGDTTATWLAGLPGLAATYLGRWRLRRDGPLRHGMTALVVPVRRADGSPAVLKLQPRDEETTDEPVALRTWRGRGAVRLLAEDPATGTMLLERLDAGRSLLSVPDDLAALRVLSELSARLVAVAAPSRVRHLRDIATRLVGRVTAAAPSLVDPDERRLARTCGAAVAELAGDPGDRLLHWDLHYANVLAGRREPWLAIDPKPLAGDPGFELFPALWNRWDDVLATGDVTRAVRRRFDLMVDVLGLERRRAVGWTLGRVAQRTAWEVEAGAARMDPATRAIAEALLR